MLRYTLLLAVLYSVHLPSTVFAQDEQKTQKSKSGADETPKVPDSVSVDEGPADEAIAQRLTEILAATDWFDQVGVEVRNSVAFIEGATTEDGKKEWAGALATNTDGVAAVVNRITVEKKLDVSRTIDVVATSVWSLWRDFLARSPLILAGMIVLVLTSIVTRVTHAIVSRVARRSRLRSSLQDLILQLVTIGVWMVGLLIAAVIVFPGMTPAKALTVLGLGSVAIGFAFKDIFENFFAGILILWKYPFDKGDFVECGDVVGKIEDITIRMTMIRQVDGQLAVVPNAILFKNPVDVLTSQSTRRATVLCGVAYDADLNESRDVIQKAVKACSTVHKSQPIEIFSREFGDSSINFEITWWTSPTPLDIRKSRDEVVRTVKQALDDANIEIPFPQRTLWLPEPVQTTERS